MARLNGVMVCGGAGFIGSHLVDRLLLDGHGVEVVDDLSAGSLANLNQSRTNTQLFRFHHLDIGAQEFGDLVALRRPSVIYHFALLASSATRTNEILHSATLLLKVLEAARQFGVKKIVVALPAALVYGEVQSRQLPIKEGISTSPMGVGHVMARALIDLLTVFRENYDLEFTALAMTNTYGSRQRPQGGVVAAFANCVANKIAPTIFGNGRQTRDFLYIDDAIDALARSLDRGGGLVINVGTGVQTSINALWENVGRQTMLQCKYEPARSGDVQRNSVNTTRARIQLGWSSWTPLESGIKQLLG